MIFEQVYKKYRPELQQYCKKYKSIDPDELESYMMIATFKAIKDFNKKSKLKSHIIQKLRYEIFSHYKQNKPFKKLEPKKSPDILEIIKYLEDDEKELILDRFINNLSLKELGKKYNRSYEWVRQRIKQILETLK